MAAKLISPTDPIEVQQVCCLIFGQPGSRKTSLAQTAAEPVTLAFDPGISRALGRKHALPAYEMPWREVVEFDPTGFGTVVVDTVGMCLDKLAAAVVQDSPKNGNRMGGLSLQGFGALKEQFKQWVASLRQRGQDIVFIAHEKAEKNGEDAYYCPDIVGGSYNTLMNVADMVGYMHFSNGKPVIDFSPTDRFMAKVPPCGWGTKVLPDFGASPRFLAELIAEAKASMGRVSEESAAIAQVIDAIQRVLDAGPTLDEINGLLKSPELAALKNGGKQQAWACLTRHAEKAELHFDAKSKAFVRKAVAVV